ncbi:MAG: UPF0280 family protein [Methanocorpusculum parvum]|nr:UPF0280 family protein [Methanocorpusculum parvum]
MIREHFAFRETITTILADSKEHIEAAKEGMLAARTDIEEFIRNEPYFQMTYEPFPVPENSALTISRMADAGSEAGVGPMASVAATVAWAGIEAMQEAGASFGLIDNGGDIVLISDRDVRVGIFAGNAKSSGKFAFIVPPQKEILGICTSSATVGPSVSFGTADAVVCFSRNPSRADAWATSLCNVITPETFEDVVPKTSSLCGVYAVSKDWIGRFGILPKIVPAKVDVNLITKG